MSNIRTRLLIIGGVAILIITTIAVKRIYLKPPPEKYVKPSDLGVMVEIPAGTFLMGSPDGVGEYTEHPQHSVTLSSFFIDKYEVTQEEYEKVMGNHAPFHK